MYTLTSLKTNLSEKSILSVSIINSSVNIFTWICIYLIIFHWSIFEHSFFWAVTYLPNLYISCCQMVSDIFNAFEIDSVTSTETMTRAILRSDFTRRLRNWQVFEMLKPFLKIDVVFDHLKDVRNLNTLWYHKKHPTNGVFRKRCSENMQKIDTAPCRSVILIKLLCKLSWNHTSAWVFSCKFVAYFQNIFS